MKINKMLVLATVSGLLIQSCGSSKKRVSNEEAVAGGKMGVSVNWIKDKGDKFDLQVKLKNNSTNSEIVYLKDIECFKNNVQGELKHTFFNTGERTIDFKPNQTKSFNMVCRLSSKVDGKEFKISVATVYDNPSGDGRIAGKKIDGPIVWQQTL